MNQSLFVENYILWIQENVAKLKASTGCKSPQNPKSIEVALCAASMLFGLT